MAPTLPNTCWQKRITPNLAEAQPYLKAFVGRHLILGNTDPLAAGDIVSFGSVFEQMNRINGCWCSKHTEQWQRFNRRLVEALQSITTD
jgi:hypothetical protein